MISLCITGHSATAITAAQAALAAAGMAPARGLERDLNINFSSWHERVYQVLEQSQPEPGEDYDDSTPDTAPATMGRLWEQLANDLFLANMDAKVWGWADAKSLGLLDFWLELDGSTHFVLLATAPEQFLAEHLAQLAQEPGRSLQDLPIDSLMDQWQQAHQTMLRFALHHPKRCVLLLAELPLPADALVQAVKGAWARKLKALRAELADAVALDALPGAEPAAALLRHFAAELCHAYPQAQSLQREMESVALALPASAIGAQQALLDSVLSTVALASQVPAFERKAADAELLLPRLKDAEEEGELLLAQLHQVQKELERYYLRNTELEAELEAKAQEQEEVSAVVHARNLLAIARDAEAQGKAEALEQLEVLGQQHQALAAERDAEAQGKAEALEQLEVLGQQIQDLVAERDAQALAKTEALQEIDSLVHARNLVAAARNEEHAQFEALDQQYQVLSAELEAQGQINAQALEQVNTLAQHYQGLLERLAADAQAKAAALEEVTALAQELETLSAQLDAEAQAKTQALEEIDSLVHARNLVAAEREEVSAQAAAAKEDYAYLLSQLQQVQEELERCYLRNKDLEATAAQVGQRFSRMVSRERDGIDWESVQTEVESGLGGGRLRCRATQVAVAAKAWDTLEFTAQIHQGTLAFTFSRRPGAPAMLTRWPVGAGDQWTATLDEEGNGALREISTSDWDLLHGLPKLLMQGLQNAKGSWPRGAAAAQDWLDAARATLPALQRQPLAVRVDTLRLQANRVLAGREYLVLRAEQLTLAHKRFAALEFRLGCNLGSKGEFGQTARLEFFKGSAPATFDQWAPNVQDPAGDRLDLVFVFPGAMNLKDWAALSVNDRGLVLLLADQLPEMLADLQTDAIRMTRPLSDWVALANRVRSFVRQRLDVTGVQQAVPEAVANDLLPMLATAAVAPVAPKRSARTPAAKALPTAARGRKK